MGWCGREPRQGKKRVYVLKAGACCKPCRMPSRVTLHTYASRRVARRPQARGGAAGLGGPTCGAVRLATGVLFARGVIVKGLFLEGVGRLELVPQPPRGSVGD